MVDGGIRVMFRGRYEHTLDSKGRLSIPARFRETLSGDGDGRLVITTFDDCLIAYPYQEWCILEERIAALPEFKRDTRSFLRFFYSSASDCTIDKLGRILVPQPLREYAKLEKEIIVVGVFKQFEIWSKDMWLSAEKEASKDETGNMLDRLVFD